MLVIGGKSTRSNGIPAALTRSGASAGRAETLSEVTVAEDLEERLGETGGVFRGDEQAGAIGKKLG